MAEHYQAWLKLASTGQFDGQGDDHSPKPYVRRARDCVVLNMVLRIFLRIVAYSLQTHSPGAAHVDTDALYIGAVAFILRLGASLNEHVHFHVCVVDGVFKQVADAAGIDPATAGVIFRPASGIDADCRV